MEVHEPVEHVLVLGFEHVGDLLESVKGSDVAGVFGCDSCDLFGSFLELVFGPFFIFDLRVVK